VEESASEPAAAGSCWDEFTAGLKVAPFPLGVWRNHWTRTLTDCGGQTTELGLLL